MNRRTALTKQPNRTFTVEWDRLPSSWSTWKASALLDTRSQVTIYRPIYDKYLNHLPLQSADKMKLWGLSNEDYPIEGVVQVRMDIPQLNTNKTHPMEVEALICPEPREHTCSPIILGTNADVVRAVIRAYLRETGELPLSSLRIHPVLKEKCYRVEAEENYGEIFNHTEGLIEIPPGGVRHMEAVTAYPNRNEDEQYLSRDHPRGGHQERAQDGSRDTGVEILHSGES
ncbi:uncharacterized protein LOC142486109 [Ascaphus truei]|uniref:uncharacterized protein LOC142486109 n=1 Tax=Ascaphus truei TaxID=8439 RepID=UPI003F5A7F18